jgi:hypothetical protein
MKKGILLVFLCGWYLTIFGQFYNRTGKNFGIYLSGSPIHSLHRKGNDLSLNSYQFSTGFVKMISSGVYPKIGYGYTFLKENSKTFLSNNAIHSVNIGVLLDFNLLDFGQRKIGSTCHSIKCGIVLTPEYRYAFSNGVLKNYSSGEFSGEIGLSFCHVSSSPSKKNRSRTKHYDFYYRNGFTPFYKTNGFAGTDKYMSKEIGFRIRFMFHKVYDFLK